MNRRTQLLAGIGLAVAVLIVYAPTFGAGLIAWDDHEVIAETQNHTLAEIWTGPVYDAWLPVYYTSVKVISAVFGESRAFGLHLANVLLHILNSFLLLLIVFRLSKRWDFAWGAAFLFALHPAATESVSWVAEHKGLLAFAFAGLAVLSFLAAIEKKGAGRVVGHLFGLALLSLGLMAKGSVLPVPLILVVLVVGLRWKERRAGWIADLAPWVLLSIAFAVLHYQVALAEGPARAAEGEALLPVFLADIGVAGRYLRLIFLPFAGLNLVPDVRPAESFFQFGILFGLPFVLLLLALLFVGFRRKASYLPALAALVLALAPYNNLLPRTTTLFAERYLYLALPAGAVLLTMICFRTGRRGALVTAGLALLFGVFTFARSNVWSDPVAIFRHAEAHTNSWLSAAKLGDALKMEAERLQAGGGDLAPVLEEAVVVFEKAARRASTPEEEVRSRIDLAGALLVTGDDGSGAVAALEPALSLLPKLDPAKRSRLGLEVHLNRGTAFSVGNLDEEAAKAYREAAREAPRDPRPLIGLAESFARLGNLERALAAAREAVGLDDHDEGAVIALAQILYMKGEVAPAMAVLTDHIARNPKAVRALCLAGELALTLGRPVDARERFERALRAAPAHPRAKRGMAGASLVLAKDALFKGDRGRAAEWAKRAVVENPADPSGAIFLAGVISDPVRAEALLSNAARLDGGEGARDGLAVLRMRRALAAFDAGDRATAGAFARRAIEAFPSVIDLGKGVAIRSGIDLLTATILDQTVSDLSPVLLGVALFLGGRFEEADRELSAAYRDAVNAGGQSKVGNLALLFRGRARLEAGHREDALTDFELLADVEPDQPWPLLFIADALSRSALEEQSLALKEKRKPRTGKLYERARAVAGRAIEIAPELMAPLLRLGEIEFASGRYLESLKLFARARREHPGRTEPRLDLAGLYKTHFLLTEDRKYLDGAEQELEAALAMDPGNARVRGALGEVLYMGTKTRRAAQELSRAVAEDPSLLSARVILGSLYVRSGRQRLNGGGPEAVEQGQRFAQLALALDTGMAGPHLLMADVLRVKKDFGPALEHLLKAESLQPAAPDLKDGQARFYKDLGFALLLSGRKKEAFERFVLAVATEAPNTDLAQVKAILSRGEEAAAPPEEGVDPKVAEILRERSERARRAFLKAVELKDERQFDAAVQAILTSLTSRETAEGRYVLGQIRREQGRKAEAERAFRTAVKQKPGLYQAWLDLGTILYFKNDDAGALECYENYLHLAGNEEPVETRAAVEARVKEIRAALDEE